MTQLCRNSVIGVVVPCVLAIISFFLASCGSGQAPPPRLEAEGAPADQNIGERLFVETRFAEYFAAHMTDVNTPLSAGDPAVSQVQNVYTGPMPGPFAGQSINCRSCHFVVEFQGVAGAGNRTYADFTGRSPLPLPMNGFTTTPRNAMQMVGSLEPHSGPTFLHFDGQFADPADLVQTTLTGRNFGWGPTQYQQAITHIADVIRNDNGDNTPAAEYGCNLSYSKIFLGTDPSIPPDCLLPSQYRLDVSAATDEQIVADISQLIAQYMRGLLFKQDENGNYYASPYDVFLRINHLPTQPRAGETPQQYDQRLYQEVVALSNPIYVDGSYGNFKYHAQPFVFGATELAGLKIFLSVANGAADGSQHAGNCAACHIAPNFTDFRFHNTGVIAGRIRRSQWSRGFCGACDSIARTTESELRSIHAGFDHSPERYGNLPSSSGCGQSAICGSGTLECVHEPRHSESSKHFDGVDLCEYPELRGGPGAADYDRAIQNAHLARSGRFGPVFPQWQQTNFHEHRAVLY